jgi:hypothetical protein
MSTSDIKMKTSKLTLPCTCAQQMPCFPSHLLIVVQRLSAASSSRLHAKFPRLTDCLSMYEPPHVLSHKSARQHRNVFIWCTASRRLALGGLPRRSTLKSCSNKYPGWRVGDDSLITVYRWVNSAVEAQCHGYPWKEAESRFDLDVLTYSVHKNGAALCRESQEIIVPGDYGSYPIGTNYSACTTASCLTQCRGDTRLYFFFQPAHSSSDMEGVVKANSAVIR